MRLINEEPSKKNNEIYVENSADNFRKQKAQKTFEKMQAEFIQSLESGSLQKMNISNIHENKYCVCEWTDNTFYRAIILKCDYVNFTADVRYIDFGNEEQISFNKMFDLHEYYYSIPENCFCCKLKDFVVNYDVMVDDDNLNKVPNNNDHVSDKLYAKIVNQKKVFAKFYRVVKYF